MVLSGYENISKQDLANSQLEVALRFYMLGQEYPAVITLAGAAEELLGKIVIGKRLEPSLKRTLRQSLALHTELWGDDVNEGAFALYRNRARNYLKHLDAGEDLHMDYEHEAASMLSRALENFHLCTGEQHSGQFTFTRLRISKWRAKQKESR